MADPQSDSIVLRLLRQLWCDDHGVVMLETVLVFPVQLLVMMVIIQTAQMFAAANVLHYAAIQGTRTAMVNLTGHDGSDAHKRGRMAAWVIASTLNNRGAGQSRIRVPANNYRFPSYAMDGADRMDWVVKVVGGYKGQPEVVWQGQLQYYFELTVPIGGPCVYHALKGAGLSVRVNQANGNGEVLMQQNARLYKPWPH